MTIGTLGAWLNEKKIDDFSLTSPSYIDFRKTLHKNSKNIELLAVEVSSHALDQNRYYNFLFNQ
jgi:UDP-N-acetylmuramoyl-L-alanyl-D-glutamate--2,6-diaminopimelate ligase